LILAQPVGKQEADTGTQRDAGTGDKDEIRDAKLALYHGSTNLFPAIHPGGHYHVLLMRFEPLMGF